MWCLDGLSSLYRQTVILSSTPVPEVNALFSRSCRNYFGKVKIANTVLDGTINKVLETIVRLSTRYWKL